MDIVSRLLLVVQKEPVLVVNFVGALAGLAVMVGLSVPVGFEAAVGGLIVTLAAFTSRAFVSPVES